MSLFAKKTPTVITWAGGGVNSAPLRYSAYTISKIAQLKMMELSLEGEKISVTRSEAALNWDNFSTIMTNVPEADARFLLFRISAQVDGSSSTSDGDKAYTFFMFYCPEDCLLISSFPIENLKRYRLLADLYN